MPSSSLVIRHHDKRAEMPSSSPIRRHDNRGRSKPPIKRWTPSVSLLSRVLALFDPPLTLRYQDQRRHDIRGRSNSPIKRWTPSVSLLPRILALVESLLTLRFQDIKRHEVSLNPKPIQLPIAVSTSMLPISRPDSTRAAHITPSLHPFSPASILSHDAKNHASHHREL